MAMRSQIQFTIYLNLCNGKHNNTRSSPKDLNAN